MDLLADSISNHILKTGGPGTIHVGCHLPRLVSGLAGCHFPMLLHVLHRIAHSRLPGRPGGCGTRLLRCHHRPHFLLRGDQWNDQPGNDQADRAQRLGPGVEHRLLHLHCHCAHPRLRIQLVNDASELLNSQIFRCGSADVQSWARGPSSSSVSSCPTLATIESIGSIPSNKKMSGDENIEEARNEVDEPAVVAEEEDQEMREEEETEETEVDVQGTSVELKQVEPPIKR
jgi:hypothetical protein